MKVEIDTASATWKFVEQHANERIQALRVSNDKASMDATQTAHTRGRIAELKELLALAKAPAQPVDDGGPGY